MLVETETLNVLIDKIFNFILSDFTPLISLTCLLMNRLDLYVKFAADYMEMCSHLFFLHFVSIKLDPEERFNVEI